MARIIENEDEARQTKDQMLADGISVLDEVPSA
jgi:hypothetical protein